MSKDEFLPAGNGAFRNALDATSLGLRWIPSSAGKNHVPGCSDAGKGAMFGEGPLADPATCKTMYGRTNANVLRYWQQRSRPETPNTATTLPGVPNDQIPGGERAFAAKVKSGSLRSSLVLGFDESLPDRLRPDEPVHLTEQRAYRGRPKSGRQW